MSELAHVTNLQIAYQTSMAIAVNYVQKPDIIEIPGISTATNHQKSKPVNA